MARGAALRLVARALLLAAWSFLVWGHLILAATLLNAFGEGPGAALARLLPGRGASFWGWLNASSAALAVTFWLVASGVRLWAWLSETGRRPPS